MRRPLIRALAPLLLAAPLPAFANMAAMDPRPRPAVAGSVALLDQTVIEVVDERLEIDCGSGVLGPRCLFVARYRLKNPRERAVRPTFAFYGVLTSGVEVFVGGEQVPSRRLDEAEREAIDRAAGFYNRTGEPIRRSGFVLELAPSSELEVEVRGEMSPGLTDFPTGYGLEAQVGRHLAMGSSRRAPHHSFTYLIEPIRSFARLPETIHATVRWPVAWDATLRRGVVGYRNRRPHEQQHDLRLDAERVEGEQRVVELTVSPQKTHSLFASFRLPKPTFVLGGVLMGLGQQLGGGEGDVWLRGGFELSVAPWWLVGVGVDGNLAGHASSHVLARVSTPMALVLSAFAGLGPVVQVAPDARLGARLELGLQFPILGAVFSWDYYPGATPNRAVLAAQIGL